MAPTTATLTAAPPRASSGGGRRPRPRGARRPRRDRRRCAARHGGLHVLLAHDARDLDRRGGDHLDVHPRVAQHRERAGGDAGMALHPGPHERDLAHVVVGLDRAEAKLGLQRFERLLGGEQVVARDRERHVGPGRRRRGSFWMIMSTFMFASASAVSTRPAMPGRSGSPLRVMRASAVECVTAVTSGRSIVCSSSMDHGTRSVIEARSAVDRARRGCARTPRSAAAARPRPRRTSPASPRR